MKEDDVKLPAKLNDVADAILAAEPARIGPLLKFRKGQYFIGENEIPLGHEYRAYCADWTRGWVKFIDGEYVDSKLYRVADRVAPPERDELGDMDRAAWPGGKDPWVFQNYLPLEDVETGDLVTFVTQSVGGKIAIGKLCTEWARNVKQGRDSGPPLIELRVGEFTSKSFGSTPRPDFPMVGQEHEEMTVLPPRGKDLDDEIPF